MASIACPNCGTPNRAGARFCSKCRAQLTVAPTAPAYSPQQSLAPAPLSPVTPAQFPPAVSQAGATAARGCGAVFHGLGRLLTLGGRAAYADLIAPQPAATGMIVSPIERRPAPTPIEFGCLVWGLAWIVFGLLAWLFNKEWWGNLVMFAILFLGLFALSWIGLRWLSFSKLAPSIVTSLVSARGRGTQEQLRFTLQDQRGQVVVTLIGALKGLTQDTLPQSGHIVRVWGIRAGGAVRAWKLQFLNTDYSPTAVTLSTARLVPLVAALFIPAFVWLLIWVAWWVIGLVSSR